MASRLVMRRLPAARQLASRFQPRSVTTLLSQQRYDSSSAPTSEDAAISDPNMNGGYINPPRIKRSLRDPYGDWWDKQERRNFGEPIHEDNDILGVFSLEEYRHFTPARAFALWGCFIATTGALILAVKLTYPDRPAVPREFPGGLEEELGGKYAVRARKAGDPLD